MTNIWFSSDHHFGHERIIDLAQRPFTTVREMDEVMLEEWNKAVGENDTVWYLGDFSWSKRETQKYLSALNGHKRIILGNHDEGISLEQGWDWIGHYKHLKIDGMRLILFHYPIKEWDSQHHGSIHMHGHTHSHEQLGWEGDFMEVRRINVCVEAWQYRPVHLDEILKLAERVK